MTTGKQRMEAVVDRRKMNWVGKPVYFKMTRQQKRAKKREEAKSLRTELNSSRSESEKNCDWRNFYA